MPKLIYLDQLHLINLTRDRLARDGSDSYRDALTELRWAVSSGRAVVPMSSTHYFGHSGTLAQAAG